MGVKVEANYASLAESPARRCARLAGLWYAKSRPEIHVRRNSGYVSLAEIAVGQCHPFRPEKSRRRLARVCESMHTAPSFIPPPSSHTITRACQMPRHPLALAQ